MDELQLSFIGERLYVWGISSDNSEIFTGSNRLNKIIDGKCEKKKIDVPCAGKIIIVPESLRMAYGQYNIVTERHLSFSVDCVEISESFILGRLLFAEPPQGILLGDSFKFFQMLFRFVINLVSRQRYIPFFNNSAPSFLINLDNPDDFEIFSKLIKKAPDSVKASAKESSKEVIIDAMGYFANVLIGNSLREKEIKLINETETDKWLLGLTGKKSKLSSKIQQGLVEWQKSRQINQNSEFMILFKLHEPDEGGQWQLSFNLQSKSDPSLITRLDEVWKKKSNNSLWLIKDLSAAATVSKTIEAQLYTPNPSHINLNEEEAIGFIARDAFLLKEMGFIVHIPKITAANLKEFRVSVRLVSQSKFVSKSKSDLAKAVFDFDYSVSIGSHEISQDEFTRLSRQKQKLVQLGGKWVELNKEDMQKVIDYFQKKKSLSFQETMRMGVLTEFEISNIEGPENFKEDFNNMVNKEKVMPLGPPGGFIGELRLYQQKGFSWMALMKNIGFGGILADDMGLGKTIQAIAYILNDKKGKTLIICPTSVLTNWQREIARFAPSLRVYAHHGQNRASENEFYGQVSGQDIVLTSYALVRRDEKAFLSLEWDNVLLDEAQNIKNPLAKQTVAITKISSKNRFCLTGTPIENRLSELWSILNFVNPGFLSTWEKFRDNFAEPIELQNDKRKHEILKRIISPFILRRLKTDKNIISDLPKKTEVKEYCNLTKEQATLYQAIVDETMESLKSCENKDRRAIIMATFIKLKQVCNHPSNYLKDSKKLLDRSGKVKRIRELIEVILQNGEKCLVFTQYKEMGDLLKADFQDYFSVPVCFLHGEQPLKIRQEIIDSFQSDDKATPRIFVLSLKAGGTGINLTKASRVIHFDRWWNPAVENQATDRAFRIGQKKEVFAHKLITVGTIEEKIDEMIARKLALSDSLLSSGVAAITELDNDELRELISLRSEALEGLE